MPKTASKRRASRVLTASRARCVHAWDRASMSVNACECRARLCALTPSHARARTYTHTHNFHFLIHFVTPFPIHSFTHSFIHSFIHSSFIHPTRRRTRASSCSWKCTRMTLRPPNTKKPPTMPRGVTLVPTPYFHHPTYPLHSPPYLPPTFTTLPTPYFHPTNCRLELARHISKPKLNQTKLN